MARRRDEFRDTWIASKAVIFMGTPHRGSRYADLGQILGTIADVALRVSGTRRFAGGLNLSLIETLAEENGVLQGLSEDFRLAVQDSGLHIISVYETRAHPLTNRQVRIPTPD